LAPSEPVDNKTTEDFKSLIDSLASVDSPDYGLSTTMSGTSFSPVSGHSHAGVLLLTDHALKPAPAIKQLVEHGPEALPLLLGALDDQRPTKIELEHTGGFGSMWFANELNGNPVNPVEQRILGTRKPDLGFLEKHIDSYTIKIGDACLVAIGQIVGRGYQAVRYQSTACIVINSPTQDPEIRKLVRAIWESNDPRQRLFESLLTDYATVADYVEGESFDIWGIAGDLQTEATMRLLYYFPKESTPLIAKRLLELRVQNVSRRGRGSAATQTEMEQWKRREVANGARSEELVKAVAWCKEPAVRDAVQGIFRRTGDVDILLAALPAVKDEQSILTRIQLFLSQVPREEGGAYGDGYNLLVAVSDKIPKLAKELILDYERDGSALRCYTVCQLLQSVPQDWSIDLLIRYLDDKRSVAGYTRNDRPIRACDEAANTLSRIRRDLTFDTTGSYADLDRRIEDLKTKLAKPRQVEVK
jgi:hypothetical protein